MAETEIQKLRDLPCAGSVAKWPQWQGLGQAETRIQEFNPGLPRGQQRPNHRLPGCARSWNWKEGLGLELDMECRSSTRWLNLYARHLPQLPFFFLIPLANCHFAPAAQNAELFNLQRWQCLFALKISHITSHGRLGLFQSFFKQFFLGLWIH